MSIDSTIKEDIMKTYRRIARLLVFTGLLGSAAVGLSACNTARGMGQDVSSVGHDTSRAANSAQQGIARSTGGSGN